MIISLSDIVSMCKIQRILTFTEVRKANYYIDTDEILGFFLLLKNHIFIVRSKDTIFPFTCEDIGVAIVTNIMFFLH